MENDRGEWQFCGTCTTVDHAHDIVVLEGSAAAIRANASEAASFLPFEDFWKRGFAELSSELATALAQVSA
jgi:hypothetical protein